MTEYEQNLYDVIADWWDIIFDINPAPVDQPSLKEQALEALKHAEEGWRPIPADCEIIRRALERLQELEGKQ